MFQHSMFLIVIKNTLSLTNKNVLSIMYLFYCELADYLLFEKGCAIERAAVEQKAESKS